MMPWELLVASALYALVAIRYGANGDPGMCIAFWAYCAANWGFILKELIK